MANHGKRSLSDVISSALDIPPEAISGKASIEISGKTMVRIESHKGLVEYDSNIISVNCGGFIAEVSGSKLELVTMNSFELVIRGEIERLELK